MLSADVENTSETSGAQDDRPPLPRKRLRLFELGSVAQACVPGAYAWFVTVAPAAWSRGAPWLAKWVALLGLALLLVPALLEPRWPKGARLVSVWGLAMASVVVWALCGAALSALRFDVARGITGMIGWGLFAYASAAPAVVRSPPSAVEEPAPLKPRGRVPRGGSIFIGIGAVLATALQFLGAGAGAGWQTATPERSVLVRLTCLALGLALVGAAASIALARYQTPTKASPRQRLRVVVPWLLALFLLAVVGIVYRLAR